MSITLPRFICVFEANIVSRGISTDIYCFVLTCSPPSQAMASSRHFTTTAGGEAVDGKYSSGSFAPTEQYVAENAPRYEKFKPPRFWGYSERK